MGGPWGTIDLCLLSCTIVGVLIGAAHGTTESSAFKVHKRICGPGWRSMDTSSPGSLTEGSPFLTRSWGQQTLCLKIHKRRTSWTEARDICQQEHGSLLDLDFPGFVAPNMIGIFQNLAREIWSQGLRQLWVGMFLSKGKLWWDNPVPLPVHGSTSSHWWEWTEGQPGRRSGECGRLDIKNGTNTMASGGPWTPQLGADQPLFFDTPSTEFRLGVSLIDGVTSLPFACINNGFELQPSVVGTCSKDWYGSPYLDKCLWFSGDRTATYAGAMTTCAEKGGHLAMPTTNFYNAYVTKVILHAELGYLDSPHPDDPDEDFANDILYGDSSAPYTPPQCIFCTDVHAFDKCKPDPDLNGSCPRESVCGVRVMKRSNGSMLYSAGCFTPASCETISDGSLKHLCHMDEGDYTLCCSALECLQQLHALITEFSCAPKHSFPTDGATGSSLQSQDLECFTCEGVSSDEECIEKGSVTKCTAVYQNMSNPVCQTKIWQESRYSRVRIMKGCVAQDICETARQDCTPLSIAPKCIYCCHDNRCNQWLPRNPIVRPSSVRTTWIGFRKIHQQLIWAGGERDNMRPWNASFGSLYQYLPDTGCGQLRADRPWGHEWLVDDCNNRLPFICEIDATVAGPVRIGRHPDNITINLQDNLQDNDGLFETYITSRKHLTLSCDAENYHPHLPVVWVKDGRFYNNGRAPGGFQLNVTVDVLYALGMHGHSVHSLQGQYHCEVWDRKGAFRAKSRPATIRFEDVLTFQGSVHLPRREYNASVHSQATLLFNPAFRKTLGEYLDMVTSLVEFSYNGNDFPSFVNIKAYRPGSLIIDYTVFYELPTVDARRLLTILGSSTSPVVLPSGDLTSQIENQFRMLIMEKMRRRVLNSSSAWYKTYGTWGVTPADLTLFSTVSCPGRETIRNGRKLRWMPTKIGSTASTQQTCITAERSLPLGVSTCKGEFVTGARWGRDTYLMNCQETLSLRTVELRRLSEIAVNRTSVGRVSDSLQALTEDPGVLVMADVVYISQTLNNMCTTRGIKRPLGRKILRIINQIMEINKTFIKEAQIIANSSSRMTEALERLAETMNLGGQRQVRLAERSVVVNVYDMSLNSTSGVSGVVLQRAVADLRYVYHLPQFINTTGVTSVLLPRQLLDAIQHLRLNKEATESTHPGVDIRRLEQLDRVRVTFSSMRSSTLFQPPAHRDVTSPETGSDIKEDVTSADRVSVINSDVTSASVGGLQVLHLAEPVLILHRLILRADPEDLSCVFWDYGSAGGYGNWSTRGCVINATHPPHHVICACNHLTHFAVLKRVRQTGNSEIDHQVSLSIVNLIGVALSIAGLSISLLLFICIRKLRKGNFQKVLGNLALSVLAADVIYVVGVERTAQFRTCVAMAALLQYFLLVSFALILVDVVLHYLTILRNGEAPIERFLLKAVLPAWGLPLVIVGIIAAVDYKLFKGSPKYCWLSDEPFNFGVLVPVAVMVLAVTVLFILILRHKACRKGKAVRPNHQNSGVTCWSVGTSVICLGLQCSTWILAFFAVEHGGVVFAYLFTISSALQGLSILVFLNARAQFVRRMWRNLCRCRHSSSQKCSDSSASSVGTMSSTLKTSLEKPAL